MSGNRLLDYLDHMEQAATDACSFVDGLDKEDFLADKRTQQGDPAANSLAHTSSPRREAESQGNPKDQTPFLSQSREAEKEIVIISKAFPGVLAPSRENRFRF
jgi:hypothetical protein